MRKYVCAASAAALVAAMAVPCAAFADDTTNDGGELAGDANTETDANTEADTNTDVDPAPVLDGLVKQDGASYIYRDGTLVAGKWVKLDGAKYYASTSGKLVCGTSKKINGKYWVFANNGKLLTPAKKKIYHLKSGYFYVNAKGHPAKTGYWLSGSKLRYVQKSGKLLANAKKQDIPFNSKGIAKSSTARTCKIKCMKVIAKRTNSKMSKTQKLRAAFNYALWSPWTDTSPAVGGKAWVQKVAIKAISTRKCQCFHIASTFAMLAYELGYRDIVVKAKPYVHAYVLIGGKAYDNMHGTTFGGAEPKGYSGMKSYRITGWGSLNAKSTGTIKTIDISRTGWSADKTRYFVKGVAVTNNALLVKGKLKWFNAKGKHNASKSKQLSKYMKAGKNAKKLVDLLGKAKKTKDLGQGCMKFDGSGGHDWLYTYKYIQVYILKAKNGSWYVESVDER